MSAESILVGLEVGTSKICAVVAETQSDGTIRVLGVGETPSRGVRKGEIIDYDTVRQCIREALFDAEERSDVDIKGVYLGVTGGHIAGLNNRGMVMIPEDRGEVDEEDVEDVKTGARDVRIPDGNSFIHIINQHYFIDGKAVMEPVGMFGRKLEADYHVVHGMASRIKDAIRCLVETPKEVEDVVFNGLASSLVVLDETQKEMGALVLDMGGGTTDYLAYSDGVVKCTGVLAVGGDHVTNDISMGLRIPMARAEALKQEEASVILGNSLPGETITLKDDTSFAGREVEREMLNTIVHMRIREIFELIKRRIGREGLLEYLGAGVVITGGASQLNGVKHLAEEVFDLPVQLVHARMVSGVTSAFENPQYSTAIGLVKYGQAVQQDRGDEGVLSRTMGALQGLLGRLRPRRKPVGEKMGGEAS